MVTAIGNALASFGEQVAAFGAELRDIRFSGPRARGCTAAASSVVLAVTLAQWAALDDVWWAGISGFMASQATRPASIERSLLRIAGTAAGAALGTVAMGFIANDHVALSLFLFVCGFVGVLAFSISHHGYAWMLGGLTANMIVMMAMNDPVRTPYVAFDRLAEVSLGSLAAVLVATLLAPDGGTAATPDLAPGWTDVLGRGWPAVQHAVRCGITLMLLPLIWNLFDLPSLSQMAITVTALMAVPITVDDPRATGRTVVGRSQLRVVGCLGGGMLGLLCLAMPLTLYPLWLAVVFAGVWVCAHIGASTRGMGYAGIQACMAFIVTLVQGSGPPDSMVPGVSRLAGITGGILVLLAISLLVWPSPASAEER